MVSLGLVQRHDLGVTDRLISRCMHAKKHGLSNKCGTKAKKELRVRCERKRREVHHGRHPESEAVNQLSTKVWFLATAKSYHLMMCAWPRWVASPEQTKST